MFLQADNNDSGQAVWTSRLVYTFAERTCQFAPNARQWLSLTVHVRIQRGNRGSGPPPPPPPPRPKNHKNIGFLSNTGLDPLKITKLPSQNSMLGHHRHASEKPFQWRIIGPLIVVFRSSLPHQLKKQKRKKETVKVDHPLTKLSGSAHAVKAKANTSLFAFCAGLKRVFQRHVFYIYHMTISHPEDMSPLYMFLSVKIVVLKV